ncbi:hypothetical protein [Pseudonocardia parietis]|uniref:DUF4386 family protein n=1 Tax=Pseudonocardia parietis TaxID=570936 RepID=A0ABS4VVZ8_9PSEU|nr:hypothetical protein [Pseudonocardia parietis]MBP2368089.1 hypothetical protein [Pseudonocardia parietis]
MNGPSARLAAATGLLFAALFVAALVLLHRAPGLADPDTRYAAFQAGGGDGLLVAVGLYLVPLAGIAFLWHMTAMRALLDTLTPTPAAMAHGLNLLSGVLFVAMLFAATAAVAAPALASSLGNAPPVEPQVARALTAVGYALFFVFAVRGAGMFAITTTTLLRAGGVLPGPVAVLGYLLAAFLLLTASTDPAAALVLPAWVVLVAASLLVHARRAPAAVAAEPAPS